MTKLLEIKDQLIRFYSKYETYLYPIVKFAVALALFTVINTNIGFMEKISRFPVALLLALVCAILPTGAILWIGAIVVLADMYALSMEVALTALILFAILSAHGALAMTTPGDTTMASKKEVEAIMGGAGARVQR